MEQAALAQVGAACLSHTKTHLQSQTTRQYTSSSQTPKIVDEVQGSAPTGSSPGHTGQPGKEDSGSGWSQICPALTATGNGRMHPPETLETQEITTGTQNLHSETGKDRKASSRDSCDGNASAASTR